MNIRYAPARRRDLYSAIRLIILSANHLMKSHGLEPMRVPITKTPPLFYHLYATDRDTCWCAWHGDKLVGFTHALNRGNQWYLAFLFVHPKYQDQKIGFHLLERVWRTGRHVTHSLCTFAFNIQAVGLYSRYGMAPLMTIPRMEVAGEKLRMPERSTLTSRRQLTRADLDWINQLESKVRGYSRSSEWQFWTHTDGFSCYVFEKGHRRVGYTIIGKDGRIGPAGAIDAASLRALMSDSLQLVGSDNKMPIKVHCPSGHIELYQMLLKAGFRIMEVDVFMSDKAYPDFQRFLPGHLGVF